MTFKFPDLSSHNAGVKIEPGTPMVCAKKTHGSAYLDGQYSNFKTQSTTQKARFFGFHWLNHGNIAAQVANCAKYDLSVPVMIDAEDVAGNTGYAGFITVDDIKEFASQYRVKGGICNLYYLPHWYWQSHMGSPSLKPLQDMGLYLVSSNYTAYSDSGPGWAGYGGVVPAQWQYTDAQSYGGGHVDFNAVKQWTVDEWWGLISGKVQGEIVALEDADIERIATRIFKGKDIQGTINNEQLWLDMWWATVGQVNGNDPDGGRFNTKNRFNEILTAISGIAAPTLSVSPEQLSAAIVNALKQLHLQVTAS